MRNLNYLAEDFLDRIEACADTSELDSLEDKIWEMRCEARDAQDDELTVMYDNAMQELAAVRQARGITL